MNYMSPREMSKDTVIPKGYRLTCISYDGSNYITITKEGLSEEKAHFYYDLANATKSCGLNNEYEPDDKALKKAHKVLLPVFEKHGYLFDSRQMENVKEDVGAMCDYIKDDLVVVPKEGFYISTLESYKIEYVPEDITFKNITSSFAYKEVVKQ